MEYKLRAYLFTDTNELDLRFEILFKNFKDVREFISCISMDYYDRVTIFPVDYMEAKNGN